MSSRPEASSKPIRRVRIELFLDTDEEGLLDSVSRATRGCRLSGGHLSLTISASDPQEALEKVRALAASIKKKSVANSKDFK